jgi:hypothetical protein
LSGGFKSNKTPVGRKAGQKSVKEYSNKVAKKKSHIMAFFCQKGATLM